MDNLQARLHLAQQRRDPNRRIVAFNAFGLLYVFNIDLQRSYWSWFLWQTLAYLLGKALAYCYRSSMEAMHVEAWTCGLANLLIAFFRLQPGELNRWTWGYGVCVQGLLSRVLTHFFDEVVESLWGIPSPFKGQW
jgi:hypothetical protein